MAHFLGVDMGPLRERFLARFESDGNRIIFFPGSDKPGVLVTTAERDASVAAYMNGVKRCLGAMAIALVAAGVVGVWFAVAHDLEVKSLWVYAVVIAIIAPTSLSLLIIGKTPDRTFATHPIAAPPRDRQFYKRRHFARLSLLQLATSVGLAMALGLSHVNFRNIDLDGKLWIGFAALMFVLGVYGTIQKLRYGAEDNSNSGSV